jgi:hypothetical protein
MVVSLLAGFTVCVPAFLWIESRCANPVVPLGLLLEAPRSNLLLANFLASMVLNAVLFNM